MAAMISIFNAFVSGQLDSFWTHAVLLGGAIMAEVFVAIGIWLESPKEKSFREWLGLGFVFSGVVVSAVFTIGLFVFDEGISQHLEAEIAPRALSEAQIADAKNRLKAFAPEVYAIGVSTDDPEQVHLADLIGIALKDAGWKSVDWYRDVVQHGPGGGGIGKVAVPAGIEVAPAPNDSSDAAKALVDVLHAEGLHAELMPFAALAPFPGIKIMIGTRM